MVNLPVPTYASNVPGNLLTSALWNANVYNNGLFLTNPPIFLAYQSAAQSIPNSATAGIGMDTTAIDSYGGHSNVTNNTRYIPQVGGWYLLIGSISYATNATGNRLCEFHKNGGATAVNLGQGAHPTTDINNNPTPRAISIVQFNGTTDYVELYAYQTSGGALNTVPAQSGMAVVWLHA